MLKQKIIEVQTTGRGLTLITTFVTKDLTLPETGLLNCFIQHTSASLVIQENSDPTAKSDLETFLVKLIPDGASWYKHTLEGPDDSPSHMRSAVTATSLNIPIIGGRLGLGTWQGIYLWEHRLIGHTRKVVVTIS